MKGSLTATIETSSKMHTQHTSRMQLTLWCQALVAPYRLEKNVLQLSSHRVYVSHTLETRSKSRAPRATLWFSTAARKTRRPIRPKPLMPIVVMATSDVVARTCTNMHELADDFAKLHANSFHPSCLGTKSPATPENLVARYLGRSHLLLEPSMLQSTMRKSTNMIYWLNF